MKEKNIYKKNLNTLLITNYFTHSKKKIKTIYNFILM